MYIVKQRRVGPATTTPSSMLKGTTVVIESEDEDLNKCRDLVAG